MGSFSIDPRATLAFATRRHVITLFKEYLSLLEGLADEHDETLSKLAAALPVEYHPHLALADYLTEEKSERLRRVVLQRGNDCARAINDEIAKYDVQFPNPS